MTDSEASVHAKPEMFKQYVVFGRSAEKQIAYPIASYKTIEDAAEHVKQAAISGACSNGLGAYAFHSATSYFIWELVQPVPIPAP